MQLRSLVFQIIEVYDFSIDYNGELETKNFKNLQCSFVRTIGKKIQDRFGNLWLRFVGGVAF